MARRSISFYIRMALLGAQILKLIRFLREMSISKHVLYNRPLVQADPSRSQPHMVIEKEFFKNKLGLYIYTRQWFPSTEPTGLVFMVHGFGEHCGRYNFLAQHLNQIGLAVFSFDLQGHGRSEGTRGYVEKFDHYVDDFLQYINLVFGDDSQFHSLGPQVSSLPRFIMGNSMGGLISTLAVYRLQSQYSCLETSWNGVILCGPALIPDPKTAKPHLIAIANFISATLPKLPLQPINPQFISQDPQIVDFYKSDPLNYTGGARARWASEILKAMDFAIKNASKFRWPLFILQGGCDTLCNPEGAKTLFNLASSEHKKIHIYPKFYHEIFNEPEREEPISHVVEWIIGRLT